jgi:hypothetical protein
MPVPPHRWTDATLAAARVITAAALVLLAVAGCGRAAGDGGATHAGSFSHRASWSAIADGPLDARYAPIAVWDGERVFVLGGYHDDRCSPGGDCAEADPPLPDGAAYDPATDEWQPIADAPIGLSGQAVVVDGVIYVHPYPAWEGPPATFLSYDIATDSWTQHPNPMTYGWLTATDDTVVVLSDHGEARSVSFDAVADRWNALPPNPYWEHDAGYPAWTGRQLIVAGSTPSHLGSEPPLVRLVALDASLGHWTDLGVTGIVGVGQQAVGDRVVWPSPGTANGGGDGTGDWGEIYPEGGIYDPANGGWSGIPPPPPGDGGICCSAATDRLISVHGSLLDPVTLEWTEVPPPDGGVRHYAAMVGAGDRLFVWGGVSFDDPDQTMLDTGLLLDTAP